MSCIASFRPFGPTPTQRNRQTARNPETLRFKNNESTLSSVPPVEYLLGTGNYITYPTWGKRTSNHQIKVLLKKDTKHVSSLQVLSSRKSQHFPAAEGTFSRFFFPKPFPTTKNVPLLGIWEGRIHSLVVKRFDI